MKTYDEAFEHVVSAHQSKSREKAEEATQFFLQQYGTFDLIVGHAPSRRNIDRIANTLYEMIFTYILTLDENADMDVVAVVQQRVMSLIQSTLITQQSIGMALGMEMEKQEL